MEETEDIKIESFEEFKQQLIQIRETSRDIVLSFYKFCYRREGNLKHFKKVILEEVEPLGLKPYKITRDLNLLFRYKKEAEAIVYVKNYGIDLLIYRK